MFNEDRKKLKRLDLLVNNNIVVMVKDNNLEQPLEVTNIVVGNSYYLHNLALWNKIDNQELCDKMIDLHCDILENKKQRDDLERQHDKKVELINKSIIEVCKELKGE